MNRKLDMWLYPKFTGVRRDCQDHSNQRVYGLRFQPSRRQKKAGLIENSAIDILHSL